MSQTHTAPSRLRDLCHPLPPEEAEVLQQANTRGKQPEIRLLSDEECEALEQEAEQARFEQEAQYRRTPEWKRLEEETAHIRMLTEEECEALCASQARLEAECLSQRTPEWERIAEEAANIRILSEEECEALEREALQESTPLEWKAYQRRLGQPRTLTPEEVAQYKQRAHNRRNQPKTENGAKNTPTKKHFSA